MNEVVGKRTEEAEREIGCGSVRECVALNLGGII